MPSNSQILQGVGSIAPCHKSLLFPIKFGQTPPIQEENEDSEEVQASPSPLKASTGPYSKLNSNGHLPNGTCKENGFDRGIPAPPPPPVNPFIHHVNTHSHPSNTRLNDTKNGDLDLNDPSSPHTLKDSYRINVSYKPQGMIAPPNNNLYNSGFKHFSPTLEDVGNILNTSTGSDSQFIHETCPTSYFKNIDSTCNASKAELTSPQFNNFKEFSNSKFGQPNHLSNFQRCVSSLSDTSTRNAASICSEKELIERKTQQRTTQQVTKVTKVYTTRKLGGNPNPQIIKNENGELVSMYTIDPESNITDDIVQGSSFLTDASYLEQPINVSTTMITGPPQTLEEKIITELYDPSFDSPRHEEITFRYSPPRYLNNLTSSFDTLTPDYRMGPTNLQYLPEDINDLYVSRQASLLEPPPKPFFSRQVPFPAIRENGPTNSFVAEQNSKINLSNNANGVGSTINEDDEDYPISEDNYAAPFNTLNSCNRAENIQNFCRRNNPSRNFPEDSSMSRPSCNSNNNHFHMDSYYRYPISDGTDEFYEDLLKNDTSSSEGYGSRRMIVDNAKQNYRAYLTNQNNLPLQPLEYRTKQNSLIDGSYFHHKNYREEVVKNIFSIPPVSYNKIGPVEQSNSDSLQSQLRSVSNKKSNISDEYYVHVNKAENNMSWRDPEMSDIIEYLSSPNTENLIKIHAAAYLQHICYNDDANKNLARDLGAIPILINHLPPIYKNHSLNIDHDVKDSFNFDRDLLKHICGSLRNLSYGRNNDENKIVIATYDGVYRLMQLYQNPSCDEALREIIAGTIWNMSCTEDLKKHILEVCLNTFHQTVIIDQLRSMIITTYVKSVTKSPTIKSLNSTFNFTLNLNSKQPPVSNERNSTDPSSSIQKYEWSNLFNNVTGIIRNCSSAEDAWCRKCIIHCKGDIDDKSIRNLINNALGGIMDNNQKSSIGSDRFGQTSGTASSHDCCMVDCLAKICEFAIERSDCDNSCIENIACSLRNLCYKLPDSLVNQETSSAPNDVNSQPNHISNNHSREENLLKCETATEKPTAAKRGSFRSKFVKSGANKSNALPSHNSVQSSSCQNNSRECPSPLIANWRQHKSDFDTNNINHINGKGMRSLSKDPTEIRRPEDTPSTSSDFTGSSSLETNLLQDGSPDFGMRGIGCFNPFGTGVSHNGFGNSIPFCGFDHTPPSSQRTCSSATNNHSSPSKRNYGNNVGRSSSPLLVCKLCKDLTFHASILNTPSFAVGVCLGLLRECANPLTLEGAAGALQNLAAYSHWKPSMGIRTAIRKEKGLPILVELLKLDNLNISASPDSVLNVVSTDKIVCSVLLALRNLALDGRNRELIGKYAMSDLISKLPNSSNKSKGTNIKNITSNYTNVAVAKLCALLALIHQITKDNIEFAQSFLENNGIERLVFLVNHYETIYTLCKATKYQSVQNRGYYDSIRDPESVIYERIEDVPKPIKYTFQVLQSLWDHKTLRELYHKSGWNEEIFKPWHNPKFQKLFLSNNLEGPQISVRKDVACNHTLDGNRRIINGSTERHHRNSYSENVVSFFGENNTLSRPIMSQCPRRNAEEDVPADKFEMVRNGFPNGNIKNLVGANKEPIYSKVQKNNLLSSEMYPTSTANYFVQHSRNYASTGIATDSWV